MKSIQCKSLRSFFLSGLTLLTCCSFGTAEARSRLSPSEPFPGPWLEITQEIRDVLTLHKVSACSQAMARQSSQDPGEYLLYCTRDEKLWTSWHVQPAAQKVRGPYSFLKISPCRTATSGHRRTARAVFAGYGDICLAELHLATQSVKRVGPCDRQPSLDFGFTQLPRATMSSGGCQRAIADNCC